MGCLRFQSLIGILVIHGLKAEQGTVVRSQIIVSIPNRDLNALDLYCYYSTQVLVTVKYLMGLITVNVKYCTLFYANETISNAEPECRPPPNPHGT
jgi:hypothetical protein